MNALLFLVAENIFYLRTLVKYKKITSINSFFYQVGIFMSRNTFEQEKIAAMTELNDEEIGTVVGGLLDVLNNSPILNNSLNGPILSGNDIDVKVDSDVLTINPIVGILSTLIGNNT